MPLSSSRPEQVDDRGRNRAPSVSRTSAAADSTSSADSDRRPASGFSNGAGRPRTDSSSRYLLKMVGDPVFEGRFALGRKPFALPEADPVQSGALLPLAGRASPPRGQRGIGLFLQGDLVGHLMLERRAAPQDLARRPFEILDVGHSREMNVVNGRRSTAFPANARQEAGPTELGALHGLHIHPEKRGALEATDLFDLSLARPQRRRAPGDDLEHLDKFRQDLGRRHHLARLVLADGLLGDHAAELPGQVFHAQPGHLPGGPKALPKGRLRNVAGSLAFHYYSPVGLHNNIILVVCQPQISKFIVFFITC